VLEQLEDGDVRATLAAYLAAAGARRDAAARGRRSDRGGAAGMSTPHDRPLGEVLAQLTALLCDADDSRLPSEAARGGDAPPPEGSRPGWS
jgi:hypothetical protein